MISTALSSVLEYAQHDPHTVHLLDKDNPEKNNVLKAVGPIFLLISLLWAFYFLRKDLFPEKSTSHLVLCAATFSLTSVSMHTLNKAATQFTNMPSTVTCIQMLVAMVVLLGMHAREVFAANRTQLLRWCVVPFAYAAMLNSSLFGYQYISLTLMTVFRNLAPMVTMGVETVIMPPEHRPKVTTPVCIAIGIMVTGALMFSWKDASFNWIGVFLVLLNTLIAIFDRVLQRRLLVAECKDLPISACMVVNNSIGMIPTVLLAFGSHEFSGERFEASAANWKDPGVMLLVLMSGFMGLGIGISGLMCQKAMTATSFQVVQNASKVGVVFMAATFFGDRMDSYHKMFGMLFSICGSLLYGYARATENAHESHSTLIKDPSESKSDLTYKACKA